MMPGRITGPMPERIIEYLGACGRFLHYKMGEKAGRRRIFTILSKAKELPQRELQDILGIAPARSAKSWQRWRPTLFRKGQEQNRRQAAESAADGSRQKGGCGAGKGLPAQSSEDGSLPFQGGTGEPPENADGPSGMLVGFGIKIGKNRGP